MWSDGTFTVPQGQLVALIGPNGSGKTTLLQMLLGLHPLAAGDIRVLGREPRRGDERVGYVPQNYASSVGDAIRCSDLVALGVAGRRYGLPRLTADERAEVARALEAVGANDYAGRRMSQLSGGQQQRVAIASALVGRPQLLLLDEPLANLDLRNQRELVTLLARIRDELGVTVVVVTHDLNPLLSELDSAIYLLDAHPHYGEVGAVIDGELLTHLYGTQVKVVATPQGDLFTRSA